MRRIFLVDDDPLFVSLVRRTFETIDQTLDIQIFADGELAIVHIDGIAAQPDQLPDLIFLDLNMPVMDGWEFLDRYSADHPALANKIGLYILSSTISPEDITHSLRYPFIRGFLIKPLDKARAAEILSAGYMR
jgi:CheY-like chemotaxis protein